MHWTLRQIAEVAGARGDPGPAGVVGVSIDSRTLRRGELFVAVRAERDGHEFVAAAVEAGAAAALLERPAGTTRPELIVADTARALLDLGRAARARLDAANHGGRAETAVIGITGSVGKTSTKDLAAAALAAGRRTVASPRSFNNELGLPLTLANAPDDSEVVVLEMGARGPGHIALLCEVARPTIGVVTAVAAAHTEMFGDLEGVARAKGELVESLPADGTAVLNGDDPRTRAMAGRTAARSMLYSATGRAGADVGAEHVELDDQLRARFLAVTPWGRLKVRLEARGAHQVGNALAALAVAGVAGVDVGAAAGALERAALSPYRMEVARTTRGGTIINDAYNANPASMAAALRALAALPEKNKIAVLGPMAELGPSSDEEHAAVSGLARELGIRVIAVGTTAYGVEPEPGPDEVVARIGEIGAGTAVLVKASRVAALERVAAALTRG